MIRRKFLGYVAAVLLSSTTFSVASDYVRATPDQAKEMLDRAVAYYEKNGLDATSTAIQDKSNGMFHDGELYVYITDMDGTIVSHGVSPSLNGKQLMKLKDVNGKAFISEYVADMQDKTESTSDYYWKNPANDKVEKKTLFLKRVADSPIFAVGIYKEG